MGRGSIQQLPLAAALGFLLLASAPPAAAQFAQPAQPPAVDPRGTVRLGLTGGVVDGDDVTDGTIFGRLRYAGWDRFSVHGQLGGLLGDFDAFDVGGGAKVALLTADADTPVDLSLVSTVDAAFGDDASAVTWLTGPLVGASFDVDEVRLTPYGGFGLGLAHLDFDEAGSDTELGFALDLGLAARVTPSLEISTELGFGLRDELPDLVWVAGFTIPL